jgi:hypothetical protein
MEFDAYSCAEENIFTCRCPLNIFSNSTLSILGTTEIVSIKNRPIVLSAGMLPSYFNIKGN